MLADPYPKLVEWLARYNNIDSVDEWTWRVAGTNEYIENLQKAYGNREEKPLDVDYTDEYSRGAYMLIYYPRYIGPIFRFLEFADKRGFWNPRTVLDKNSIRICILGAGPAPEVLGMLAFLDQYVPAAKRVHVDVLDINTQYWAICHRVTQYELGPLFFPDKEVELRPHNFDLLSAAESMKAETAIAFQKADLFVTQFCLNEQLELLEENEIVDHFLDFFALLPAGKHMILIDTIWKPVRALLTAIEKAVVKQGFGRVIYCARNSVKIYSPGLQLPEAIRDYLPSKDVKDVKYIATVLERL